MSRSALASLLALLWAANALAGGPRTVARDLQLGDNPTRPGEVRVAPRLTLDAISAAEINPNKGAGAVDMGQWRRAKSFPEVAPVLLHVTRSIPNLWRLRVMDTVYPGAVDVRYQVFGTDGKPWHLTHVEHPEAALGVAIEPTTPVVIHADDQGSVIEGGAVLQLSLDGTRYAGTYTGTVVVTVNNL